MFDWHRLYDVFYRVYSWLKRKFVKPEFGPQTREEAEIELKAIRRHIRKFTNLPKPGSQAIAKGYGRHFKGKGSKHQLPSYRRSVRERKQPEDED